MGVGWRKTKGGQRLDDDSRLALCPPGDRLMQSCLWLFLQSSTNRLRRKWGRNAREGGGEGERATALLADRLGKIELAQTAQPQVLV